MQVWSLGWEDALEKEMAIHLSILAWEILWTEEPGGLQSLGSQKSQTWLSDRAHTHAPWSKIFFPSFWSIYHNYTYLWEVGGSFVNCSISCPLFLCSWHGTFLVILECSSWIHQALLHLDTSWSSFLKDPPPLWLANFFSSSRFQLNCHGFREVFPPLFINLLSWQSL